LKFSLGILNPGGEYVSTWGELWLLWNVVHRMHV